MELELVADILRESAVSWRARFNISRNWNRFEKSYSGLDVPGANNPYVIGRSLFGFYVYKNLGIIQNSEDVPSYFDQNMYENNLYAGYYTTPYREGMYQLADLNGDGLMRTMTGIMPQVLFLWQVVVSLTRLHGKTLI